MLVFNDAETIEAEATPAVVIDSTFLVLLRLIPIKEGWILLAAFL